MWQKENTMKYIISLFFLLNLTSALATCVDLSGTYMFTKGSCQNTSVGISLPMNAGQIHLQPNETLKIVQKDCNKLYLHGKDWKYSLKLKTQEVIKVMQSNYGYVVNEYLEKFNFCKKVKFGCKKFTKDNKWLLEVTAEGNLFIQNDLLVKRYNDLKKIELEQHARCELTRVE